MVADVKLFKDRDKFLLWFITITNLKNSFY